MASAQPPTFHIPIGLHRQNGEVVPFAGLGDQVRAMKVWHQATLRHPATVAAGAFITIGPTTTTYVDVQSGTATQSPTPDGAWEPAAVSDVTPNA